MTLFGLLELLYSRIWIYCFESVLYDMLQTFRKESTKAVMLQKEHLCV